MTGAAVRTRRALLALVAAWPLGARAYRPFDSTDAAVAPRGALELELGPLGYLVQGSDRALVAPSVVVNWGFAEGWEAVLEGRDLVELGPDVQEPRLRIQDTTASVKRVLREGSLQEKEGPSVATELGLLLPAPDRPGVGVEATAIVSQRWPDLTLHVDGAAAWTGARPGAFAGVIVEGRDAWRVRPVGEVFVERERGVATTRSGLVGTIWRATDALSLDAAVRRARVGTVTTTELRLGVTWGVRVGFPR